jgi:molecular chaperone DnaK
MKTEGGLGPEARYARQPTGQSGPLQQPSPATTLRSAEEAALMAREAVMGKDVTELSAREIGQKYGSLPLILPRDNVLGDDEPTAHGADAAAQKRAFTGTAVLSESPALKDRRRTEESVPAYVLDDSELEDLITADGAQAPPIDEVTRRVTTGIRIEDIEESLPVPDLPETDEITGTAPYAEMPPRSAPRAAAPAPAAPWRSPTPWPAAPAATTAAAAWQPAPAPWSPHDSPRAPASSPSPLIHQPPTPPTAFAAAPLLVDVTPLTLGVETVSGWCDPIIERNTPVPCERARAFVTASDNQTNVRVRVSQGESARFSENTLLGELELTGLRAALRGQVQIAVNFSLDTDGLLNVSATDVETGRAVSSRVRLVGIPDAADVQQMAARQQAIIPH